MRYDPSKLTEDEARDLVRRSTRDTQYYPNETPYDPSKLTPDEIRDLATRDVQYYPNETPYETFQGGKGQRSYPDKPNEAPRPYDPYAGTGGRPMEPPPRPSVEMPPPNQVNGDQQRPLTGNSYFGNQGDVFGRPDYMYGSPQRSPYAPERKSVV